MTQTKLKPSRARASPFKFVTASKTQSTGPREARRPLAGRRGGRGVGRRPHVPVPLTWLPAPGPAGGRATSSRCGFETRQPPLAEHPGPVPHALPQAHARLPHERRGLCAPVDGAVPPPPGSQVETLRPRTSHAAAPGPGVISQDRSTLRAEGTGPRPRKTGSCTRTGDEDTDTHRGDHMGTRAEDRSTAQGQRPREERASALPGSRTPSLQAWEEQMSVFLGPGLWLLEHGLPRTRTRP